MSTRSDGAIREDLAELVEPHATLDKAEAYDRLLGDVEPLLERATTAEAIVGRIRQIANETRATYGFEVRKQVLDAIGEPPERHLHRNSHGLLQWRGGSAEKCGHAPITRDELNQ